MTKDGSEEGAQPEWPSFCLDHRQNFGFHHDMFDPGRILDMRGALRNARDDAGDWKEYMVPPYEYEEYVETAAIQVIWRRRRKKPQFAERAAGGTHDAGLQPSDATELAGLGGMQGGIVVPLSCWTSCTCPWSGKHGRWICELNKEPGREIRAKRGRVAHA